MKLKEDVKVQGIASEIVLALILIEPIATKFNIDLVVTSVRDGTHGVNSKHKLGYAVDIRTRDLLTTDIDDFAKETKETLSDEYFVLVESDHIHIQFNGGFL